MARGLELKERSAAQSHFNDLCQLLGEPTPTDADPSGEWYCFERGARKDSGGDGWADVWKRGCFAWEYKGRRADLDAAFNQLRQYAFALENPPLLIVSDMARFRIRTAWTNSVSEAHEFTLEDLADGVIRDKLKWAMSDLERLRPGETRQTVTERSVMDFRGIDAKLDRARNQVMALSADIDELCANIRQAIVHEIDTDAGEQRWVYRGAAPEVPIEWSIRVGEILYNLRSALDHLAWQLVLASRNKPTQVNRFPILDEEEEWTRASTVRSFRRSA